MFPIAIYRSLIEVGRNRPNFTVKSNTDNLKILIQDDFWNNSSLFVIQISFSRCHYLLCVTKNFLYSWLKLEYIYSINVNEIISSSNDYSNPNIVISNITILTSDLRHQGLKSTYFLYNPYAGARKEGRSSPIKCVITYY